MSGKRKMAEGAKRKSAEPLDSERKRKRVTPVAVEPQTAPGVPSTTPKLKSEKTVKAKKPKSNDIVKADFMPLDTTADQKRRKGKKTKVIPASSFTGSQKSAVIYVGRIPHGFYEDQMRGFFSQFGDIKRLRLSRNKKTGKSKHYAFIEFQSPEVAPIVAEAMHNYLLFESMLQVKVVPLDKIKPTLWVGANKPFKMLNWQKMERERFNKVLTPKEQSLRLESAVKKDKQRRKKIQELGIDYDYPELEALVPRTAQKVTFDDNED